LRSALELRAFTGDGGIGLPDQVGVLKLDVDFIHRTRGGFSLRLGLAPGLYSEFRNLSGRDFFIPFRVVAMRSFNPVCSGFLGAAVYPDFDHVVDPRVGLRWAVLEGLLLDLAYPESAVTVMPDGPLWVSAGLKVALYPEYQLEKDDPRERLLYDEKRWYGRVLLALSEATRFFVEAGQVFDREIAFAREAAASDLDDALYVKVGLGGFM
jgi:hypothetical protein